MNGGNHKSVALEIEDPKKLEEESKIKELKAKIAESDKKIAEAQRDIAKAKADADLDIAKAKAEAERDIAKAKAEASASGINAAQQKAIAEAERDAIKARRELFIGPDITPPTGDITTNDKEFIETRILSNKALSSCLNNFVENFSKYLGENNSSIYPTPTLIIYNKTDFDLIPNYVASLEVLEQFKNYYSYYINKVISILNPKASESAAFVGTVDPLQIPLAAAGIVKSVAEVFQLFRTTTDFKNEEVVMEEYTTISLLKGAMLKLGKNWMVYYPSVYPINIIDNTPKVKGILSFKQSIEDSKKRFDNEIKILENEKAQNTGSDKEALEKGKQIDAEISRFKDARDGLKELASKFNGVDEKLMNMASKSEKKKPGDSENDEVHVKENTLLNLLRDIYKFNSEADLLTKQIEVEVSEQEKLKANITGVDDEIKKIERIIEELQTASNNLKELQEEFNQINQLFNENDSQGKITNLANLNKIEKLVNKLKEDFVYIVKFDTKAKGSNKISKNLFMNARIKHSAGCELSYCVFGSDGSICFADCLFYYFPYKSSKDISRMKL